MMKNWKSKKKILREYDVIDEEGNISTPIMGVDLPVEDHPGLDSDIGKEVKKLKKKLLGNNNQLDEKNEGE